MGRTGLEDVHEHVLSLHGHLDPHRRPTRIGSDSFVFLITGPPFDAYTALYQNVPTQTSPGNES